MCPHDRCATSVVTGIGVGKRWLDKKQGGQTVKDLTVYIN